VSTWWLVRSSTTCGAWRGRGADAVGLRFVYVDSTVGVGGDIGTSADGKRPPTVYNVGEEPPLLDVGRTSISNMTYAPIIA